MDGLVVVRGGGEGNTEMGFGMGLEHIESYGVALLRQ